MNWQIEVTFGERYLNEYFGKTEIAERVDAETCFEKAIKTVVDELGVFPCIGDWIDPLSKPDYSLDGGEVTGRRFCPKERKILFEIG
jgi:hypothetical protein